MCIYIYIYIYAHNDTYTCIHTILYTSHALQYTYKHVGDARQGRQHRAASLGSRLHSPSHPTTHPPNHPTRGAMSQRSPPLPWALAASLAAALLAACHAAEGGTGESPRAGIGCLFCAVFARTRRLRKSPECLYTMYVCVYIYIYTYVYAVLCIHIELNMTVVISTCDSSCLSLILREEGAGAFQGTKGVIS